MIAEATNELNSFPISLLLLLPENQLVSTLYRTSTFPIAAAESPNEQGPKSRKPSTLARYKRCLWRPSKELPQPQQRSPFLQLPGELFQASDPKAVCSAAHPRGLSTFRQCPVLPRKIVPPAICTDSSTIGSPYAILVRERTNWPRPIQAIRRETQMIHSRTVRTCAAQALEEDRQRERSANHSHRLLSIWVSCSTDRSLWFLEGVHFAGWRNPLLCTSEMLSRAVLCLQHKRGCILKSWKSQSDNGKAMGGIVRAPARPLRCLAWALDTAMT